MSQDKVDPSFKSIIDKTVADRSVVMTVGQLGFPEGANLHQINQRVKELGFEELTHHLRKHGPTWFCFAPYAFVLRRK